MEITDELKARFKAKVAVDETTGCHIWQGAKLPKGYGIIKRPRERRQIYAHRLALMIEGVEVPDDRQVLHSCDNPPCVNPAHLRVGTNKENHQEMKDKGRSLYGERNGQAKLTEAQVEAIRVLYRGGESQSSIAKRFGIHQTAVSKITRGARWEPRIQPDGDDGPS